jgi:hypothetical protein
MDVAPYLLFNFTIDPNSFQISVIIKKDLVF